MPLETDLPDNLRAFDDYDKTRELIYSNTLEALQKRFPITDGNLRLELKDTQLDDRREYSLTEQKKALLTNKQLRVPVRGTWRLIDETTGQLLGEKKGTVMRVPYYSQRGTLIHNGSEYSVVNQQRLKPGTYTRQRKSGEIETQFNVTPGTGRGFRIWMEPATGIFRVATGTANVPAHYLLRMMGVTDDQMREAWGDRVYQANATKTDAAGYEKLYNFFVGKKAVADAKAADMVEAVRKQMTGSRVDPWVVKRTLGLDADNITPDVLLRSTKKVMNVHRGDEAADDRDHPMFSNVLGVEDFIRERIDKDAGRTAHSLLYKLRRSRDVNNIPDGALNPYMQSLLLSSGLTQPLEETNSMQLYEQAHRISRFGEGGIGSPELVTEEARDVNPGQVGFIDTVAGPESERIGTDVRAAWRTYKGKDGQIYGQFLDKAGKSVYLKPEDMVGKVLAFSGQPLKGNVYTLKDGDMDLRPAAEVDYVLPSQARQYSFGFNLTPMSTGFMPTRGFYASKYVTQFMPLQQGEAPLVQTQVPGEDRGFHNWYGRRVGTLEAPVGGVVSKVTADGVTILDKTGKKTFVETPKNFPFNRMTAISYAASVKEGDVLQPGDMIARSNFTDDKGSLAMGRNLKTAVLPYKGMSFDDAYVISESAAKKMAVQKLYGFDKDAKRGIEINRNKYTSLFPGKFTNDQLGKLDDGGVVREGQIVNYGDPIILATGPRVLSAQDAELGRLHKVLRNSHRDESVIWEHEEPGIVTDVGRTRSGYRVNIGSTATLQEGDKIANQYATKGVVSKILPDEEMPVDQADGKPFEVLFNPMTVPSRTAPNQLLELQLGKIAQKLGQPVLLPAEAPDEGWAEFVRRKMEEAGITSDSVVVDPKTGKQLGTTVTSGYMYMSPFHHMAEKKLSSRDVGGYTQDEQPARGGFSGAKRMSQMDMNALFVHGAHEVLKDAQLVRGARNEEFWNALRSGRDLPAPKVPFVYNKFIATLKAGGVNVTNQGDILRLAPITDNDVAKMSAGAIKNSNAVDGKLQPLKGGIFDPAITGGFTSNKWSHIELTEPMPNPIMEEPIRRILGLTVKDYAAVLQHKKELPGGGTGAVGIYNALDKMNIDQAIEDRRVTMRSSRGTSRDNAAKSLRYLLAARDQNIHPREWVITKVPVLPPVFRPISQIGDAIQLSDMNELYRELIEMNSLVGELKPQLPAEQLADERIKLYSAVQAAYGLGESISPEGQSKRLKGAIRQVVGTQPKTGMFQSRVFSKTVDSIGRGVAIPDANLDMDTVGIPENMAWDLFRPFVIRRLARRGFPPAQAAKLVADKTGEARQELERVMSERPVLLDRAPTWHKFNLLAFRPVLTGGSVIRTSPLIVSGFNLDFDGNCCDFDSYITVKLSKSILDTFIGSMYRGVNPNKEKEDHAVVTENSSIVVKNENDDVTVSLPIGNFPRSGTPLKDKNGADVYPVEGGIQVASYDSTTGEAIFAPVHHLTVENDCDCVEVVAGNRAVVVSSNESLAIFSHETGQLEKRAPKESLGGFCAVTRNTGSYGTYGDAELGWFTGMFLSDGWTTRNIVGLAKLEDIKRDRFVDIARRKVSANFEARVYEDFGKSANKLAKSKKVHCYGRDLADIVRSWDLSDEAVSGTRQALTKRIPADLLSKASEEFLWGLLSGLIDGDGSVVKNMSTGKARFTTRIATSSEKLKDGICELLHRLGLRYSVTTTPARKWSKRSYTILPSTVDLSLHLDRLICCGERETSLLGEWRDTGLTSGDRTSIMPITHKEADALAAIARASADNSAYTTIRKYKENPRISVDVMRRLVEHAASELKDELTRRVKAVTWVTVDSVMDAGKRTVFDFEVEGTKVFAVNNGLVIWDTMNVHVPATDAAAKQALERMLPSRNIFKTADLQTPMHSLGKEMVLGLYQLTQPPTKRKPTVFRTKADMQQALAAGLIDVNDPVIVNEIP